MVAFGILRGLSDFFDPPGSFLKNSTLVKWYTTIVYRSMYDGSNYSSFCDSVDISIFFLAKLIRRWYNLLLYWYRILAVEHVKISAERYNK